MEINVLKLVCGAWECRFSISREGEKMKKVLTALIAGLTLLVMTGVVQATLITIGTANYGGMDYKLIYDDDDTGHGGGGLVWLDYTHSGDTWWNQRDWASGLGASLTVTLDPGYTDIDLSTGWRLPDTVDGTIMYGHKGDPDNDGVYDYTGGYNLANSEMGHLYYAELGNLGWVDTDGNQHQPGWGLTNTGDFDNLIADWYWSGTEYAGDPGLAWGFHLDHGHQGRAEKDSVSPSLSRYGLAVHSGNVSVALPSPNHPLYSLLLPV
jgi:hypothetical protein